MNSTVIGEYDHLAVRLPGGGGAPEIALGVEDVFVMLRQSPRTFVDDLDFTTSSGERVRVVVTDLGVLEPRDGELTLTQLHPGVEPSRAREATGWELRIAQDVRESAAPNTAELTALRSLRTKGDA